MIINNSYYTKKRQCFGSLSSVTTQVLRYLNTNPSLGATSVDLTSMSVPRTVIDGVNRGLDAGAETGVREGSGTGNHALIGTYGLLASALLSQGINKTFNVKANKIFTNFESIDTIGSIWHDLVKANQNTSPKELRKLLFEKVLTLAKGKAQNQEGHLVEVCVDKESAQMFMKEISQFIEQNPDSYKISNNLFNRLKTIIAKSTTAENDFILKNAKYSMETDLENLLKSTFSLGKLFSEPKALKVFKNSAELGTNKFIKMLKNTKLKSSVLGVAIGMAIGAMVQPFNVWLTKKRTGKEGFVGVEGEKPDNSLKFKVKKAATALAFLAFGYATIVGNIFKIPLSKQIPLFLNKMQFNGLIPSIAQFKAVYAFTIASRLFSSRSENELRESKTKDFLGYINWLILGDFVNKTIASLSKHNLTNYDPNVHGKGILKRIFNSKVKVKTHDEILFEELKKHNMPKSMLTSLNGNILDSKQLLKLYYDKLPNLKARIRGKNIAQLSGYLYSMLVLGILIPKINIAITNHFREKNKKQQDINNQFINSSGNENFKIFYSTT